jgi:hypothetical protein
MNTNVVHIVKQIIADNGEAVLNDPKRLKAFFSDLAKDEPKPLRTAFGRCIEAGAYAALKDAPDAAERAERKAAIAQRLRDEHGLDITLCGEALDILEAALPAEKKETTLQYEFMINFDTENTTEGQAGDGELLSEEIGNLQKIIAEKNDQLIRCVQDIERLTEEKKQRKTEKQKIIAEKDDQLTRCTKNIERLTEERKQSEDEKERIKNGRTTVIVLAIIALAVSIGVGVSKYNEIEGMYYSLQYDYSQLSRDYEKSSSDYEKSKALWAINVTKLEVGNWSNKSNEWITRPGSTLYASEVYRLKIMVNYKASISGNVMLNVKWYYPGNDLRRWEDDAPSGYTYSINRTISTAGGEFDLGNWGWDDPGKFLRGTHKIELWYKDVLLNTVNVELR